MLFRLFRRWPFVSCFALGLLSNAAGSAFNFAYNKVLIVDSLTPDQRAAFWNVVAPAYNLVAYPLCLGLLLFLIGPLSRCLRSLRAGFPIRQIELERCRRRLVNLPFYVVCVNFLGWVPGAVVFPLGIGLLAGWDNAAGLWSHFVASFLVSALMTTVQTFFLLETFLIAVVYPEFFAEVRPAEVLGAVRIPFRLRLGLYWVATAVVPLASLLAVLLNLREDHPHVDRLGLLAVAVAVGGVLCSALIAALVGRSLLGWVRSHARATEEIALGNLAYRIEQKRPDELGRLTDRFNDMAWALGRARELRETFGRFVRPDVRDEILQNYQGLGGEVQEVTVLFADIRGFTHRSADEPPERLVELLNRFFSLAVEAVERESGWLNKFLGDGLLFLFGWPRRRADHADRAVRAARALLLRLEAMNHDLAKEGRPPLRVGIGIHTGPALVGCFGATWGAGDGVPQVHCELSALGETVNLGQRVEQLTKTVGGPVLLTEQTRGCLREPVPLTCLGPQHLDGYDGGVVVYRVDV